MRWPQIRAGLIALAIGFGLVDGCPLPPPDRTPAWERGIVEPIRTAQHVVEWPVAWLGSLMHVSQQWAVYQAPGTARFRLQIAGETYDRQWHVVYRAVDPDHREDAELIEHPRVWSAWDPSDVAQRQYGGFCAWITARVLARHAEFGAARVALERIVIVPGGFSSTGELAFECVHARGVP